MKKRIACLLLTLVMIVGLIPVTAIRASAASFTVSEAGIRVIKEYMGFHKNAYQVAEGVYKIGYGTPSVAGATITEANADQLLREELARITAAIDGTGKITATLVQKRMDALVWLSYVEGTSWLNYGALVNAINSGITGSAFVDAMVTFDYDTVGFTDDGVNRSILNRRMAMANLYLNGSYNAYDTGSLSYTVFDAGEHATFPNGARKMVQAYVSTYVTKINVSEPNYDPSYGTVKFHGWYTGSAMVTGVGAATKGAVLYARWQMPTDDKLFSSYTLPAYVIYKANGITDDTEVAIVKAPNNPVQIDVLKRDAVVTVVAETSLGGQKWLQLSTGGWVKLCNDLNNVPVTIPAVTVTITDDYVNIRKEPDVMAEKVGTIRRGETRTIAMLSADGKWGYCPEGWILLAYTTYDGSTAADGKPSLGSGIPGTVTGAANVNVRSAAGVGNPLVTTVANGTSITVYEQTTVNGVAWGHIDQGWICMQYVKLQQSTVGSGSNITTGASAVVSSSVSLNVRSGPGTIYSKIATLAPGTSVVILRKETVNGATWGLIDQGWINLSYVTPIGSSDSTGTGSVYSVGGTVVNCATGVNIRAAAGPANALVGVAGVGTRVNVTEITTVNGHKWGHIDRGWVCMDYVQLDSEFKQPENIGSGDGLDNVVASFEGYPAVTLVDTNLLETASAHAKSLLTLRANAIVNILAWTKTGDNLYGKVTEGNKTGWVNMNNVKLQSYQAKVTVAKADIYEEPSTRSKFYATLVNGTYVCVPTSDGNVNWRLSDGTLWGKITASVNGVSYIGWMKLSNVTMFKGNVRPAGVTSLSGVGYLNGKVLADTVLLADQNGSPFYYLEEEGFENWESTSYTLTAGTRVNILARNYYNGEEYGKVTMGSVTGWIEMSKVELDPVVMTIKTETYALSPNVKILEGNKFTVRERKLLPNPNEINHGVVDVGFGYLNDDTSVEYTFILDDGKLVPTGEAITENPGNPTVVSSVVVTGITNTGMSVYEEAVEDSRELLKLNPGTNVTVLNWKNVDGITWGKVQFNKVVGWVKTSEVDFSRLTGVVAGNELKVYALPDKASALQLLRVNERTINIGSKLVFDDTTLWGYINMANYLGWIDLSEVTLNTPGIFPDTDYDNVPVIAKGKINSVNATTNIGGEIKTLPKGTEVSLIEVVMDSGKAMWLVDLGEKDGWIDMDCVTMYSTIATVTDSSAPIYDDLTLTKTLYTLYRDEKATILSYYVSGSRLYGEVACDDTTGWILICDELNQMHVRLTPGSTGSGINTGNGSGSGSTAPTTPTTPTTPVGTEAHISCVTTVNVRSGAGVDKPLVTTLANGTNVKVYEQTTVLGKQWARIDQGWVCMDYVKMGTLINIPSGGNALNGGSGSATIMTTVPAGAIAVGYANQDLKIRSGSGLGYEEVGSVKKGYSIAIYENKLDGGMSWGRTDNGWVCTSYLTITGIGVSGSGSMGTIAGSGFTVNVRSSASSGGALMAKVMMSSRVAIHETIGTGAETWGRTDLGWINMQYVVLDSASAIVPGGSDTTATTPTESGENEVG